MKAMLLNEIVNLNENRTPLEMAELPDPVPGEGEILVRVKACGVCHTEIDEIEGRTPPPKLPVVLGHQIVGKIEELGKAAKKFNVGDRVGIGWIYSSCQECEFCQRGEENLCEDFLATGRDADGGYARYTKVHEDFAFEVPELFSSVQAAPLLCAGAIGYRSLRLAGLEDGQSLGLTGFGASAHLVLKMARRRYPDSEVFVFARTPAQREFALDLGASWAGDTAERSPEMLHAIIDTTPAWRPVVEALKNLVPGGRLVINAIRKEDADKDYLLNLDYPAHLWMEKEIKSVANVAPRDIREFLALAAQIPIMPTVEEYGLKDANRALTDIRDRRIRGAKVLVMG